MFEIEIIGLLNKYKNSVDEFSRNKIKSSIKNIIFENSGEFDKFINSSSLDSETVNFLKSLENVGEAENNQKSRNNTINSEVSDDLEKIKQVYVAWRDDFVANSRVPNVRCEQLVNDMINFYIPNRFYVLKKVLSISDDNDFESFKNMLNNYIRKYFASKISKFYSSSEFSELGFFDKRSKKKQIIIILDELAKYDFDEKKILEVFN